MIWPLVPPAFMPSRAYTSCSSIRPLVVCTLASRATTSLSTTRALVVLRVMPCEQVMPSMVMRALRLSASTAPQYTLGRITSMGALSLPTMLLPILLINLPMPSSSPSRLKPLCTLVKQLVTGRQRHSSVSVPLSSCSSKMVFSSML